MLLKADLPIKIVKQRNAQNCKERKLKIKEKSFPRISHNYAVFPEICLAGKWLQDVGFTCGQSVKIDVEQEKIIITLI